MIARVLRLCPLLLVCVAVAFAGGPASAGGATFVVNLNTDDDDLTGVDGVCDTFGNTGDGLQCTLRAAIEQANNTPDLNSIDFNIGAGGLQTIQPLTALPPIDEAVILDGTSQPNCPNPPCIDLDGNNLTMSGLILNADASEIRGLIVERFNGVPLDIYGDGNTIAGNWFGTDPTGLLDRAPSNGPFIRGNNNTFGGTDPADRNIVAGHGVAGIFLNAEFGASNNDILGNYIGVGADGATPIPNAAGIFISYYNVGRSRVTGSGPPTPGTGNVIGPGNVISGNMQDGICMCEGDGLTIVGNLIGTDASGENPVPNGMNGIRLMGSNNIVGGTTAAFRNVISGNTLSGIQIIPGTTALADDNLISGNYIGTDADGEQAISNDDSGITQEDASDTTIGGTSPGARNVISGNLDSGVRSGNSTDWFLQGNYIGTDATGVNPLGNGDRQVIVDEDANVQIGGDSAAARNVVSAGGFDGIRIARSEDVDVIGNYIGLAANGTTALGNARDGLQIGGDNTDIFVQANVIVDNASAGIGHGFTDGTRIVGNWIGETPSGTPMGNTDAGIRVWGSSDLTIGDVDDGDGNVISNNGTDGIEIDGNQFDVRARVGSAGVIMMVPSLRNTIRGNSIHSNTGLGINNIDTGNTELAPPIITGPIVSGPGVQGTACANCIIDVYSDDVDEGRVYEGSMTANGAGAWSFPENVSGPFTTATATDSDGNTSEFSAPVTSPEPVTPTPTPEATATATPTPTPVSSATPGPTPTSEPGTPTPTPTGSETPAPEGTQGDTDCDEDVDSVDGLFVLREVAGLSTSECIESGDIDCDEDRDSVDALGILRHVAALPPLAQQEPCADIGTPV